MNNKKYFKRTTKYSSNIDEKSSSNEQKINFNRPIYQYNIDDI